MRKIRTIIVHHSAGPEDATVESVRAFHIQQRGYSDIGYHWCIRRLWRHGPWTIEPGRPMHLAGAHDKGQNADSIGVCVFGNFVDHKFEWPVANCAAELVVALMKRFGLTCNWVADPDRPPVAKKLWSVQGHKENEPPDTPTLCPGFDCDQFREYVEDMYIADY